MTFPVFHGITLAANSFIENLHVEVLAADPMPIGPGRVWFNSTDKVFKYSGLNNTGAVVVRSIKDAESAAAELAALTAAYQAGDAATLASAQSYTDAAKADALAAVAAAKAELLGGIPPEVLDTITELATALQNNPDVIALLQGSILAVQAEVDAEEVRAQAAEASIRTDLAAETANRVAADAALDSRVDALEASATAATGNLAQLTTDAKTDLVSAINEVDAHADQALAAIAAEVARAQAAEAAEATARASGDATNAAAIAAETSRAQAAEAALAADLAAETTARQSGDAANAAAISAETTRAQAAEASLASDIAAEAAARAAADTAEATARASGDATNAAAISAEATRAQAAEAALQGEIDAEEAARAAGDTAIRAAYNATVFTFQAMAGATVHTILHNLNTGFTTTSVMVERAGGGYYNDYVAVEEVDANTVKVYLSQALKIKAVVRSAATI